MTSISTIVKYIAIGGIVLLLINLVYTNNNLNNMIIIKEDIINTLQKEKNSLEILLDNQNNYITSLEVNKSIISTTVSSNTNNINNKYKNKLTNINENSIDNIDKVLHDFSKNN